MEMNFEVPSQFRQTRLPRKGKHHYAFLWCTKPIFFRLQINPEQKMLILGMRNFPVKSTSSTNILYYRFTDAAIKELSVCIQVH